MKENLYSEQIAVSPPGDFGIEGHRTESGPVAKGLANVRRA
jgi:hypothetical protein